jgi:hypothetical protein
MIQLHYRQDEVLAMFFLSDGNLDPKTEEIQQFDKDLFDADEAVLVQEMNKVGLDPADLVAKSRVLLYSRMSGGGSMPAQVRQACIFFKNTSGL